MRTTNVSITEQEQKTLQFISQQTGTSQTELLHKAVQMLIAEFERHFGTLHANDAGSVDNEQIDADLARVYAATNEEN